MRTAFILNDTSGTWHSGCDATMAVLRRILEQGLGYEIIGTMRVGQTEAAPKVADAELVICNGEGSIHHRGGADLLRLLGEAADRGQATALVNALYQPDRHQPGLLAKVDVVATRDPLSHSRAQTGRLFPELALSACPPTPVGRWPRVYAPPQRVLYGQALFCPWWGDKPEGYEVVGLRDRTFAELVELLGEVPTIYVTGEHHGAYAAILAGASPVLLPTQTWKLDGLLCFGLPAPPICQNPEALPAAIEEARELRRKFLDWRGSFLARTRLMDWFAR